MINKTLNYLDSLLNRPNDWTDTIDDDEEVGFWISVAKVKELKEDIEQMNSVCTRCGQSD